MVKKPLLLLLCVCFLNSCNVDLSGLIASNDLDIRLKEKNNFNFLKPEDLTPALGDEYSFIVLADTHLENGNTFGLEKLTNIIEADTKFVVICGDITQSGQHQDMEKFTEFANTLDIPCYPVIGNHDIYFDNWTVWKDLIGSTCYKVEGDTATLFILDSANSFFGDEQLDWLERELKTAKRNVFVFAHANLFILYPFDLQQFTDTRERARVLSILDGRCDVFFNGHAVWRLGESSAGVQFVTIENFRSNNIVCLVRVKTVYDETIISWEFLEL